MAPRRCPDCGVTMEEGDLQAHGRFGVRTHEPADGLLGRLGVTRRIHDLSPWLCPECGLVRLYADVD